MAGPAVIDYSSSDSDSDSDGIALSSNPVNTRDGDSCDELDHTAAKQQSKKRKLADTEEIIMAEFEFFDLRPDDLYSVRSLLSNWLDGYHEIDLTAIADAIVNQVVLGTIAKTDSNTVALATILPLTAECMAPVNKYLMDRIDQVGKQLLTSGRRIGVLIYERFVNLPWQLIPDLFDSLQKDLLWARQNAGPDYDYDLILLIARSNPCKNRSTKVRYLLDEHTVFSKACTHSCSFAAVPHSGGDVHTRSNLRTMIVIERARLPEIVRQMTRLFK